MNGESLLNLLQQKLLSHPDYAQLAHKLKCDVQTHPTRDEQRTILSALSKYDKENKLITTVQQCLLSLGYPSINSAASEVLVTLIKKDKSTVFVLHQFLNQPLPGSLRAALWNTIFNNEAVGAAYTDAVRDKPYSTLSPQENIIKEKAKGFIQSTPGFSDSQFLHSSTGHQLMIKSLSYWHIHVARPLTDTDYKLIIPVIALGCEDDDVGSVTRVVSMLSGIFNLLHTLKASDIATLKMVLQYVQLAQPDLSEHIMLLRADLTPVSGTSNTSPIVQLVAPLHERLFVGYLSEDVIKYFLDQCVIGNDVPAYNPLFSFTATVLCLMASALSQCNNVSSVLSHIEQRGVSITVKQIQQFIQVHYLDSLATQLSTKPTRVHFNTKPTTLGEDRESADNRRLLKELEELKKKLSEEKKQRNDRHIVHRNEMGVLRAENEDLRRRMKAAKSVPVAAPIVGPPVVLAAPPPPIPTPPPLEKTPEPASLPDEEEELEDGDISGPLEAPLRQAQVQSLWLDIARSVMQRVKRLAFKNPARKKELDSLTFYLNKQYEEDRAKAEVELFGSEIPSLEWEGMSEEEYYDKIYQIDTIVEKYARERFQQEQPADKKKKKK